MGRATVINEIGAGLYLVEVKHDTSTADAQVTKLDALIAFVETRISETEADIAAAAEDQLDQLEKKLVLFETRLMGLEKRKAIILAAKNLDFQTQAWCADLTLGLSGDVGTIEPGSEYENGVNLRPGAEGDAGWNPARDGQAVPFLTMDVADAMRNFAILPAVQKWRPNYRYGIISDIDVGANTCRVTLDALFSSQQDLDVNQGTALGDVPVEYMTCNAAAFAEGDAVIVQFEGFTWESPKVIGFKDHPKSCFPILVLNCGDRYLAWDYINQEVLPLGDLEQPATYSAITAALDAMGFTMRTNPASESLGAGRCDTWTPTVFSLYGRPDIDVWWPDGLESNETYPNAYHPNYYGETLNTNENIGGGTIINTIHIDVYLLLSGEGEDDLSGGETFSSSYHEEKKIYSHVVREIYLGTLVSSTGNGYRRSGLTERKAVNGLTAARLSHTPGEKRRACFYYQDSSWNYYQSGASREASYEKTVSYRSMINPDDSAENITTVTGACASYSCEYSILNEYNFGSKVSTASPVKAMLKDEIAFVLEQPVIYNQQTGETWGFSKLYFTMDGAKPDPASPFEYSWEDLVLMDMDAIYAAFGTTFPAEMNTRRASAGISIALYSSE